MKLFRRRDRQPGAAAAAFTAVADRDPRELRDELDRLAEATGGREDRDAERRLLRVRHELGLAMLGGDGRTPSHPEPDTAALPQQRLPEIAAADVTPGLLRAGILRDGCLLVRGLVGREDALALAAEIDRAFAERTAMQAGGAGTPGYYDEFVPAAPYGPLDDLRPWIQEGGGVLAADSPKLAADLLRLLRRANFDALVEGYLGEPLLLSAEKTTLRKAEPTVTGAWHQDGKFMGEVRALNLWLSLSRCGDVAPGLDIVPKRLEHIVAAGTDDTFIDIQISDANAREAAGDTPIERPVFEPGDALLFDDLFLHQTGSDPSMPNPRYAVESWFFGASAFPEAYRPLAV